MNINTLKPRYNEQVRQTLFVHYIEKFTISNVIWLVNPQNGSWVLFTISKNSLYQGLLYQGLSVLALKWVLITDTQYDVESFSNFLRRVNVHFLKTQSHFISNKNFMD